MARLRFAALSFTVSLLVSGCYTQLRAPHANRHYGERHIPPDRIWYSPAPVFYPPSYDPHDWWLYGNAFCDVWIDRYHDYHPWIPFFRTYVHYDHHRRPGYGRVWRRSPIQWRPRWRHRGPRFEPLSPTIDVEIVVVERRSRFRRDGFAGGVPGHTRGALGEELVLVTTQTSGSFARGPDARPVESRTVRVRRPEKIKKSLMPASFASGGERSIGDVVTSIDVEPEVAGVRSRFRRDGFAGGVPGNTPGVPGKTPDVSGNAPGVVGGADIVTTRTSGSSIVGPDASLAESRTDGVTRHRMPPSFGQDTWANAGSDLQAWGPVSDVKGRPTKQPKPQTNWFSPQADSRTNEPELPGPSRSEVKNERSPDWSWSPPKPAPQIKPGKTWTPSPVTRRTIERESTPAPTREPTREPTRSWSPPKVEKRPQAKPRPSWSLPKVEKRPEPRPTRSWSPPKVEKRPEPKPTRSWSSPKVEKRPEPKPTRSWSPHRIEKRSQPKPTYTPPARKEERKREVVRRPAPSKTSRKEHSKVTKKESSKKTTQKKDNKNRGEKRRKSGRRRRK